MWSFITNTGSIVTVRANSKYEAIKKARKAAGSKTRLQLVRVS